MVTVEEALHIIERETQVLEAENLQTELALGRVLAQDVQSSIAMPPFDQSAMDGFALGPDDGSGSYRVVFEIPAGRDASALELQSGECARIFTGSMTPQNCRSVIQQELVERMQDQIFCETFPDKKNIRWKGEQFEKDRVIATKGTILNPGTIGFILSAGITHVNVLRKARVAAIVTGSELIKAGEPLLPGQIYESNSAMLSAAFQQEGIHANLYHVEDNEEVLYQTLQKVEKQADLILFSGGISVGDYDFVRDVCQQNGVEELFYKVQQKPGKPLYFGKKGNSLFFALPGNPSSALTCFYVYVRQALALLEGKKLPARTTFELSQDYHKKGSFTNILRARVKGQKIEILERQSSAELNAWAQTNALIILPAEKNDFQAGESLEAFTLSQF